MSTQVQVPSFVHFYLASLLGQTLIDVRHWKYFLGCFFGSETLGKETLGI